MSDRDEINRVPLGDLESGERYVGCLHFRDGVSFVEAAGLLHDIATFAAERFGQRVDTDEAEVCREFNFGVSEAIYPHPVILALEAQRDANGGES